MEVDSSIEVFDLSLQREAPSSISEEASSFFYEYFLENQTCYHTAHELLSTMFPISQAVPLKDQALLYLHFHNTHNVTVVTVFQTWTDRTCFRGCWNGLTDINILLCTVMASWISSASYNIKLECKSTDINLLLCTVMASWISSWLDFCICICLFPILLALSSMDGFLFKGGFAAYDFFHLMYGMQIFYMAYLFYQRILTLLNTAVNWAGKSKLSLSLWSCIKLHSCSS